MGGAGSGGCDSVYGAAVNTGAAVGAGIGVDDANVALFGDSAEGAAVVTSTAVNAIFSDGIGQGIHLLCFEITCFFPCLILVADSTTPFYAMSTPKDAKDTTDKDLAFSRGIL
jgi:hypothetical protein